MIIVSTLWFFFPAYISNAAPLILSRLLKNKTPLDLGKRWRANRVLGDGKTFEGTLFGIFAGLLSGLGTIAAEGYFEFLSPIHTEKIIFTLVFGSILGDIVASFIKRRLNLKRGEKFFPLDQLDFYFGAVILTSFLFFNVGIFLLGLVITPLLHTTTNTIAHSIGIKRVSW